MWSHLIYSTITSDGITPIESPAESIDSAIKLAEALEKYGPFLTGIAILCTIFMLIITVAIVIFFYDKICNSKKGERIFGFSEKIVEKAIANFFEKNNNEENADQLVSINDKETRSLVNECMTKLDNINSKLELIKPAQKQEVSKDRLKNYWKARDEFTNASKACISVLGCSRVSIYLFHNGNKSLYGFPFFKITCVYDLTSSGSKTYASESHIDCPLNIYGFINDLYISGTYINYNIDKTKEENEKNHIDDRGILTFLQYSETKSIYIEAIKTDNDALCGFAAIEFNNAHDSADDINNDYIMRSMESYIKTIKPIICNYGEFDKT